MGELTLRTLRPADTPELLRIHRTPEVRRWWGDPEADFPDEDSTAVRWTVLVDGAVAGLVQFAEELEPRYRHASIDIFLDPAVHGRGVGTEVVTRVVEHLVRERGHHRVTIDPAVENRAAVRAYEKAGFTAVGVMHDYEGDVDGEGWHDGLLMELIAST